MEELLKNISVKDLEKLRLLLSIMPTNGNKEIITLRVFYEEYSNLIKQQRSDAYYISVKSSFKHLINFFGAQKSIREIGIKEVESFCNYIQHNVKPNTKTSTKSTGFYVYYRTIKAAFNKAVEWGYINENSFTKIKLPKKQKLVPGFITSYQLSTICDQIKIEDVRNIVVFAFYTGMRLDEIMNLRWKNVDLNNGVITVGDNSFITKGRKQRFIPMSEEAKKAIENLELRMENEKQKDIQKPSLIKFSGGASTGSTLLTRSSHGITNGYVFCKKDGSRYTGNYISRKFKRACRAAGIDPSIRFHSLRHSFASDLVQKGVPLYTIKELLGHSSISTTEIYSHLNMDALREAILKLDASTPLGTGSSTSSSTSSELRLGTGLRIMKEELNQHTPAPSEQPFSRGDNYVKIFRINSSVGE